MISHFRGTHNWLSNFYPVKIHIDGWEFASAEHAFQALKSFDSGHRMKCSTVYGLSASEVKKLGRTCKLRYDWETTKLGVMTTVLRDKFKRNKSLSQKLLDTGYQDIIEGNYWNDTYWGVDLNTGQGENHLGQIIMQIRGELQNENY